MIVVGTATTTLGNVALKPKKGLRGIVGEPRRKPVRRAQPCLDPLKPAPLRALEGRYWNAQRRDRGA